MNIDTSEFRALTDRAARVDEYHRREALLIRTLAWLTDERPDLMRQASHRMRPQLRVIRGGRL